MFMHGNIHPQLRPVKQKFRKNIQKTQKGKKKKQIA